MNIFALPGPLNHYCCIECDTFLRPGDTSRCIECGPFDERPEDCFCKHFGCDHQIENSDNGRLLQSCPDHIRNCQCIVCGVEFLARGKRVRCYGCNPYNGECCVCKTIYPWGSIEMPLSGMIRCLKCEDYSQNLLQWHKLFITCDFARPRADADADIVACMGILAKIDPNIRLKIIKMIEERSQGSEIVPTWDEYGSDSE